MKTQLLVLALASIATAAKLSDVSFVGRERPSGSSNNNPHSNIAKAEEFESEPEVEMLYREAAAAIPAGKELTVSNEQAIPAQLEEDDSEYFVDAEGNRFYVDEEGNEHYIDEEGNEYYIDEEGNEYYIDEKGNAYYIDEDGNIVYYDEEAEEPAQEAAETPEKQKSSIAKDMSAEEESVPIQEPSVPVREEPAVLKVVTPIKPLYASVATGPMKQPHSCDGDKIECHSKKEHDHSLYLQGCNFSWEQIEAMDDAQYKRHFLLPHPFKRRELRRRHQNDQPSHKEKDSGSSSLNKD